MSQVIGDNAIEPFAEHLTRQPCRPEVWVARPGVELLSFSEAIGNRKIPEAAGNAWSAQREANVTAAHRRAIASQGCLRYGVSLAPDRVCNNSGFLKSLLLYSMRTRRTMSSHFLTCSKNLAAITQHTCGRPIAEGGGIGRPAQRQHALPSPIATPALRGKGPHRLIRTCPCRTSAVMHACQTCEHVSPCRHPGHDAPALSPSSHRRATQRRRCHEFKRGGQYPPCKTANDQKEASL